MRHEYDPLDETLADLADIKVEIDQDTGLATLSGVHYSTLRSILTAASLHQYDNPFEPVEIDPDYPLADICRENAEDSQRWHWVMRDVINYCSDRISYAISPKFHRSNHGIVSERKYSRKSSWAEKAWYNKGLRIYDDFIGPLSPACIEQRNAWAKKLIDEIIAEEKE